MRCIFGLSAVRKILSSKHIVQHSTGHQNEEQRMNEKEGKREEKKLKIIGIRMNKR